MYVILFHILFLFNNLFLLFVSSFSLSPASVILGFQIFHLQNTLSYKVAVKKYKID